MSLTVVSTEKPQYGFPRVSGDEPALVAAVNPTFAFSPRERG